MKRLKKFLAAVLAACLVAAPIAGCGASDPNRIDFWIKGSESEVAAYKAMVDEFNASYGASHGIKAALTVKTPGQYDTSVVAAASTTSGPDVFLENEDNFKKNVGARLTSPITAELGAVTDVDISDIYPSVAGRYRYNAETKKSGETDDIYGLPLDSRPTALYYNETLFRQAGVLVISVDEADTEAFWAGEKADNRGKTRADYEAEYDRMKNDGLVGASAVKKFKNMTKLPKKGFYREKPTYGGSRWNQPNGDEVLVFNNRIAMNWDEAEDLARLFNRDDCSLVDEYKNNDGKLLKDTTNGTVEYGFFTEWWFMYGWSVGGDCLTDLSGNGDYNFSLLDPSPNYIVADGKIFTGASGTVYAAGETLGFNDKYDLAAGEIPTPNADGTYSHTSGEALGIRETVTAAKADGTLAELPSIREAFERYVRLGASKTTSVNGKNGINVSPNPNLLLAKKDYNWFWSGQIAMIVEYSTYMPMISEYMDEYKFTYDVAPLLVYKEYANPADASDDTVKARGKVAGQSNSMGMVVRRKSEKKEKAAAFIAWMASKDGQRVKAKHGLFPNQAELLSEMEFASGSAPQNVGLFKQNLGYQTSGDWWYMEDYEWINVWANDLNTYVRNGTMSYDAWASEAVTKTNNKLASY